MILSPEELLSQPEFSQENQESLTRKLEGLERLIRAYTNNNFQLRAVRFWAVSSGNQLLGSSPYLAVGDRVEITDSLVNDGLYTVTAMDSETTTLDKPLYTQPRNLVTKVVYPADVQSGVLNLLKWELENRDKVGIKSETLSRHSVTYYDQDASNTVMGYPVSLLGFLKPYRKARF